MFQKEIHNLEEFNLQLEFLKFAIFDDRKEQEQIDVLINTDLIEYKDNLKQLEEYQELHKACSVTNTNLSVTFDDYSPSNSTEIFAHIIMGIDRNKNYNTSTHANFWSK